MIHELLQITGSHNVEGTLILPNDTGSAQKATGSVAHQNGEIFIFNGQNWQTLGAQTGITQPNTSLDYICLLYTSPSPRDSDSSRMPSSA